MKATPEEILSVLASPDEALVLGVVPEEITQLIGVPGFPIIVGAAGSSAGTSIASALLTSITEAQGTSAGSSTAAATGIGQTEASGTAAGTSTATALAETGISPEAQAVLDRMSALSPLEESSIITFVDGMVADGNWDNMEGVWCPALNGTDFLTDFISDVNPLAEFNNPNHVPGEYIEFTTTSYVLTPILLTDYVNSFPYQVGCYQVQTSVDTTGNTDYFGCLGGGFEAYCRWRGDDTFDYNIIFSATGPNPRPVLNTRSSGDVISAGNNDAENFLQSGTTLELLARTNEGFPPIEVQFNGRNNAGAPNSRRASRYSFMFIASLGSSTSLAVRGRILQFLINLGVSGVPTP